MNTISIHPRGGNVCHIFTFSGSAAILLQYLSTILRNIIKKTVRTAAVISISHQRSSDGCFPYALIPFNVMVIHGMPQIAAARKYRYFRFISYLYFVNLYF